MNRQLKMSPRRQHDVHPRAPDGGWGYCVLIGASLAFSLLGGMSMTHTLVYQALIEKFQQSASATAWVLGLEGAIGFSFSPVSSFCCKRYGCRVTALVGSLLVAGGTIASAFPSMLSYIYITYGIITGMGHSMVLTSCFLIIPLYFDKKRARANGISSVGTSIGGMVLGPLLTILFLEFGYPGAMVIIGGMMLNLAVSGALFRPIVISPVSHTPNGGTEYGIEMKELSSNLDKLDIKVVNPSGNLETHEEEVANDKDLVAHSVGGMQDKERFSKRKICNHIFDCSVMKSKSFFGFCLANMGIFVCMSSNTFLAGLAKEKHVSDTMIALILMVTSATNCVSRIISGFLFDLNFLKKRRILIFLLLGFLAGFIMCLLPFTQSIATIFIVNMATNIFIHAFHAQHVTILCDMVGQKKMADALGIARMFMGVGWLCGPVIGGVLKDWRGHYSAAYYFGGVVPIVCMILCLILNIPNIVSRK